LNDTEEGIRDLFAHFFAAESTLNVVREAEPLGFDRKLWSKLWQTGAPMMSVPESLGGGGASSIGLAILAEEYGRNLAPVPLVEHLAATRAIALADRGDLLDSLSDESTVATLALAPVREGVARLVPAGAVAGIALVWDGDELVALRRASGSLPPHVSPRNFGCSPIADWSLDDADIERIVLADGENGRCLYSDALSSWRLLTAAALNGLGARALAIAVDYVKERKAFGVPIGWFQSVRHRLADAVVAGDGSALLAFEAAWSDDVNDPRAHQLAAMAFIFASETTFHTCREALQFHGGYGVTLEYDIQMLFRRAKAWPLAIGDIRRQYHALGNELFPIANAGAVSLEAER
jgi:alkylation response protein AidB-like acyl-CoA dehydrogenase